MKTNKQNCVQNKDLNLLSKKQTTRITTLHHCYPILRDLQGIVALFPGDLAGH